ncbi:MAG: phage baseplate assembly protein W [Halioglobus sp.]|jgi:phage baseplate assembly protein W
MADSNAFFGAGWSFPPSFSASGRDVHLVSGQEDIEQSLAILLATQRDERVMQEDFGCNLNEFLFAEISQGLSGRICDLVECAILHHEPRIILNSVDISDSDAEAGMLLISIDYTIRTTNSRFNMVYPFYLNEAALSG